LLEDYEGRPIYQFGKLGKREYIKLSKLINFEPVKLIQNRRGVNISVL
jgi:hypothetical protein